MILKSIIALFALNTFSFAQTQPAFNWAREVDASGVDTFAGLGTDAQGNTYLAGSTRSSTFPVKSAVQNHSASPGLNDVYVTKLDGNGNIVYSTYFGGSSDDFATAMTVDPAGNVYVSGTTQSPDFPTTLGTWSPGLPPPLPRGPVLLSVGNSFLFKLGPDGSVVYSTYFAGNQTKPTGIALDGGGSVYIAGVTYGGLPTTPGAYQTTCECIPVQSRFLVGVSDAFVARFDAAATKLIYSTYMGVANASANSLAVALDGSVYVGSPTGIYRLDATGSSLLASAAPVVNQQAMAIAPNGNLYVAGISSNLTDATPFQPSPGAFQSDPGTQPSLPGQGAATPSGIIEMNPQLDSALAATYFGASIKALTFDSSGNVFVGGYTGPRGLPTRSPFVEAFGSGTTGFMSKLSGDLSTLLFSSYFGDSEVFGVQSIAISANGSVLLGGSTGLPTVLAGPTNVWVNSLALAMPAALRIDSVGNAASRLGDPISSGETIVVEGAGFAPGAQLSIGGVVVPAISIEPTRITAVVPSNLPVGAAVVQVQSGGVASNPVLVPVAAASPGLFSADGSGFGQGYVLNSDGTVNTPSNPALPGDKITIYATGVGPVSFAGPYAVTQFAANVFIDGFYCSGIAAVMGPVSGFPGDVYQLTVYVPNPATMVANNSNLLNFKFPPLVSVVLAINGAKSQNALAISIRKEP